MARPLNFFREQAVQLYMYVQIVNVDIIKTAILRVLLLVLADISHLVRVYVEPDWNL